MVQPILPFKKISTERQYGSSHALFLQNFGQKTIPSNVYCLFRKFWPEDNRV